MGTLKQIITDIAYIIINYFIAYIPCWHIRKLFYLMTGMRIGKGSRIAMRVILISPWKIVIGERTMINEFALLDGRGHLRIGDDVSVSMWSVIYTGTHKTGSDSFEYLKRPTSIGDKVWIGARAVIFAGSEIQHGCVVGANSTFGGSSEPNSMYVGVPSVIVKRRKITESYRLSKHNFFFR